MGCISSKAITRSISIREELNHGFRSTTSAWEELLTSHGSNDQLFALICSSNANSTKLKTSSFTLPSSDGPKAAVETKHLGKAWDMIADIKGKAGVESDVDVVGEADQSRFTRSKSCQITRATEMLLLSLDQLNEQKLDRKDENQIGSRSFHTVDEYDALLETIHKLGTPSAGSFEEYYSSNSVDEKQNTQKTSNETPEKRSGYEDLDSKGSDSLINSENFVQTSGARETRWKRKAAAKGLKSLDVSAVEFPAVARFRQRMREGQGYFPGDYATPRFGSYNRAASVKEKERLENTVFSAELLAEFEECMHRLQVDEDIILREMDGFSTVGEEMA